MKCSTEGCDRDARAWAFADNVVLAVCIFCRINAMTVGYRVRDIEEKS